jgi:hypothetical protein
MEIAHPAAKVAAAALPPNPTGATVGIPVTVEYQGTYNWHQTVTRAGAPT